MIIPIRCFTCGKVTGNKWLPYTKLLADGVDSKKALTQLGLVRYCCRRILLTHVDSISNILNFQSFEDENVAIVRLKRKSPDNKTTHGHQ